MRLHKTRPYFLFILSVTIVVSATLLFAPQHTFAQQKILLSVSKNIFEAGKVSTTDNIINCDLSCSTAGVSYKNGDSVTITAVPYAGYVFAGWSGDCSGTNPTCALTMNSAKNVAASFNSISATVATPSPSIILPPAVILPVVPSTSSAPQTITNPVTSTADISEENISKSGVWKWLILGLILVLSAIFLFIVFRVWRAQRY